MPYRGFFIAIFNADKCTWVCHNLIDMKICTECRIDKGIAEFGKSKKGHNGLRAICKECHNRINRKWAKDNKDRVKERERKKREANPILAAEKRAVQVARRADKVAIYGRAWRLANPGKANARTARRRAAKLNATPKWLTEEHWEQIESFYVDAARLTKETGIKHEVDHIEPLQGRDRSGLHVPWNLQIMTKSENASKGNRALFQPRLHSIV